ncbi:membrane transporter [Oryctes borbonicus]|uniref:Membrane transporter n=1 Tax=Oryctes borbonicus TaxID=1629725 RepID=A0A0T6BGD1_9SCAR|nr:membrane transporter [Oryctes borbonicus]
MVIYTFTLNTNIVIVYIVSTFLGFSMTGLLPVGFELASELTFPEPEGTSTGVLNASSQLFGVIFTSLYSVLFEHLGDQWANGVMCIMLAAGVCMTACIKSDLKRQAASSDNNQG